MGSGGQGGCERRIEVIVKIQKKNGGGGGVRVDVNEELEVFVKKKTTLFGGGVGWMGRVWGSGWM